MFSSILLLAASAVGSNYGWEPLPEGGMKYIFQFDLKELEDAQKAGAELGSEIPSKVGDVRAISIRLGSGPLPQIDAPLNKDLKFPPADSANREKLTPDRAAQVGRDAKPQNSAGPPPLLNNPSAKLLASQAGYNEPAEPSKASKESKTAAIAPPAGEPAKPWWPLTGVSLALRASLGGNAYLLWIFAELRKRYRAVLAK